MISERVKIWGGHTARWSILGTLTIFLAFPFVWMLITAFKRTSDLYDLKHNPFLFYEPPTLEHIHRLFSETQYGEWLLNTAFVGVLVVIITLVLAVPAGYALARLTGKVGRKTGHRYLPDLSGSTHAFVHPAVPGRGEPSPGRFSMVAGAGLPIVHRPFLGLADDGLLQSYPKGCGRGRHGRRL